MVNFISVLTFDKGNGNKSEISISKIRNKIMIRKNCIEKVGMTGVCVIKPHSNEFHFCNVISDIKEIVLTNTVNTVTKTMLIIVHKRIIILYEPHQYKFKYKNSQTTSTKCQYHAAHSNPVKCSSLLFMVFSRNKLTIKNVEPMITCNPWNPVAMKNVEP